MSRGLPARALPRHRWWWWLGGALAGVLVVTAAVVLALQGTATPSAAGSPGATATPGTASSPAPTSATPTVATPSASVTVTPTPTPTPTPVAPTTRAVQREAYCAAFSRIRSGSISAQADDGGIDYDELAGKFTGLIRSYSRAAAAAPSSLDREYAAVLGYLREMRAAVQSRDLDGIKLMITNLELLNQSMAAIEAESEEICG